MAKLLSRALTTAVGFAALAAAWFAGTAQAQTQTYPDKTIKLIVPGSAGGPTDVPARLVGQILPRLGQSVVVENRAGAGGVIGARSVIGAAPDGYTLMLANTSVLAVIPAVSVSAGYDPSKDFAAVAKVSESYQILVVHPSWPWKTVKDLVAHAKANPGKLTIAQTGAGGLPHLAAELFKASAGIDILGVPYNGGAQSVTGLLGKQVDMTFESITVLLPLIRDGKLRALAVTSKTRTPLAPDLPTMIEAGIPGYEVTTFYGVVAPAGTPTGIVNRLNATINEGLKAPEMQATLEKIGAEPSLASPAQFSSFIATQFQKWKDVGRAANVKVD